MAGTADQSGELTPPHEGEFASVDSLHKVRTAYYDARSEKSLSHEEAKLFYQRHQLEQPQLETDAYSPLARARTTSSTFGSEEELSRTASISSPKNGRGFIPRENWRVPTSAPDSSSKYSTLNDAHTSSLDDVAVSALGYADAEGENGAEKDLGSGSDKGDSRTIASDISPELSAISVNVKEVLNIRHRYINLSLQGYNDNPRDGPDWRIYPPPPKPSWDMNKGQPSDQALGGNSLHDSTVLPDISEVPDMSHNLSSTTLPPSSPTTKSRKPGQDIGEDFDISDLLPLPSADEEVSYVLDDSSVYQIFAVSEASQGTKPLIQVPKLRDYYRDLAKIQDISSDGPTKSFAYRQLDIIEGKFHLYFLVNSYQETADCKQVPHRDFYNVRKVDTHVHHSACMNQKHLLRFIKSKMRKSPDEIVMFRDGMELTLKQVFQSINLTAYDLSIDTLDMHAHTDSFHRFDKFNLKYNPIGESRLREIFLKTDNYIKGRYLAEITKEVISDLESSKYQFVEWRVSVYGRSIDEWDKLAAWVIDNKLVSHNVRWLVQIPRLYSLYKANRQMDSFEQILVNIFQPLYEATKNPSKHAKLHVFLQRVVGFDSVDDESKAEVRLYRRYPPPREWNTNQNPPYTYWMYHLFANMASLNQWRQMRGFNTFVLRPHCGEAGDIDHIAAAVLCCHSISHGLMLRKVPLLQYIFYLDQIGIAMSPLSNNALFLAYERNPFQKYFKRGLNVSLSTDDPLQFAFTKEPLIEEYSVAAQIYRLSAVDMCELAHHSVMQSGFEHALKQRWLGPDYHLPGVNGNSVAKSNVPNIREKFRYDTLMQELNMLDRYAAASEPVSMTRTPSQAPATSSVLKSSATNSPLRARTATIPETDDIEAAGLQYVDQVSETLARSASMVTFSSIVRGNGYWNDRTPPPPRIFPGVVHERTRRGSLRQGSSMEKEADAQEYPRS